MTAENLRKHKFFFTRKKEFFMSFSRPEKQAVMPRRSVIDSNDSLFNPKKVFTIVDAIDHPPSSYTLSSGGSDFAHEYSFENQNLDIFKKPHPMSSTTNTTSSVDVDEEDVSLSFINILQSRVPPPGPSKV